MININHFTESCAAAMKFIYARGGQPDRVRRLMAAPVHIKCMIDWLEGFCRLACNYDA
jgi:hypothetical protein